MARRSREINIFNIAFLDVITGAMGAFVLMVLLLAPYYSGSSVQTQQNQQAAQSAVARAQRSVQQAQASQDGTATKQALQRAQRNLADAQQQLGALSRQLDQLSAQNKRLAKVDDEQQKQIAQLQQQLAQASQQALDRAEQNLARADQAVQSGDVAALRRLLAQARADLAQARQQLAALQQQLSQAQAALQQETQRNAALTQRLQQAQQQVQQAQQAMQQAQQQLQQAQQANARLEAENQTLRRQVEQLEQELAQARQQSAGQQQMRQERDQAIAQRNQAQNQAAAAKNELSQSAALANQWVLATLTSTPACDKTQFVMVQDGSFKPMPSNSVFPSIKDYNQHQWNANTAVPLLAQGFPGAYSSRFPYQETWILPLTEGASELVGLRALSQPPPGCVVTLSAYSWTHRHPDGSQTEWEFPVNMHMLMRDQHSVLVLSLPPTEVKPSGNAKAPTYTNHALTAEDIAHWSKAFPDGVGPALVSPGVPQAQAPGPPDLRKLMGPPSPKPGKP